MIVVEEEEDEAGGWSAGCEANGGWQRGPYEQDGVPGPVQRGELLVDLLGLEVVVGYGLRVVAEQAVRLRLAGGTG